MTRGQIDEDHPVLVFYPVDRDTVPPAAVGFAYTTEDTWGAFAGVLPPAYVASLYPFEIADTWTDLPASTSRAFPLVVLNQSAAVTRFEYSLHSAHLASWGYVVAVPEHPTRDRQAQLLGRADVTVDLSTVTSTIDLIDSLNRQTGSPLEGAVAMDSVAVEGHSVGGAEALLAAHDSRVDTWIELAPTAPVPPEASAGHDIVAEGWYGYDPAAGEFDLSAYLAGATPPGEPSMLIVAGNDLLFPVSDNRLVFDWLAGPKRFVVLADTGHFVFTDGCARGQQRGGVDDLLTGLGLDRASVEARFLQNGCTPQDAPVGDVTALWNHLTVAQLNLVFGIDPSVASAALERSFLDATFPGRLAEYVVE